MSPNCESSKTFQDLDCPADRAYDWTHLTLLYQVSSPWYTVGTL